MSILWASSKFLCSFFEIILRCRKTYIFEKKLLSILTNRVHSFLCLFTNFQMNLKSLKIFFNSVARGKSFRPTLKAFSIEILKNVQKTFSEFQFSKFVVTSWNMYFRTHRLVFLLNINNFDIIGRVYWQFSAKVNRSLQRFATQCPFPWPFRSRYF